jgi:hypothetical protein
MLCQHASRCYQASSATGVTSGATVGYYSCFAQPGEDAPPLPHAGFAPLAGSSAANACQTHTQLSRPWADGAADSAAVGKDHSAMRAMDMLYWRHKTTPNQVLHLWSSGKAGFGENQPRAENNGRLGTRYSNAFGDVKKMRALVDEGK